jgi:hypothetical protein
MVRTLGGCVSVAICSAVHREYLNDHLSSFLSPTQITAVLKSSGYIAGLPEETRNRIGGSFGGSYNKQFHIILAFAGVNLVVTILLAIVRKRMGIYGAIPERKEANEFTQAAEPRTDDVQAVVTTTADVDRSSIPNQDTETITMTHPKHEAR